MPAVKNVGEPCAREPHARFEVAAGGNQTSRASTRRAVQAPLADPTNPGAYDRGRRRVVWRKSRTDFFLSDSGAISFERFGCRSRAAHNAWR